MVRYKLHHCGIAVKDLSRAVMLYEKLFGYSLISKYFDDPIQKVSVCFLGHEKGDVALELVAPLTSGSPIDGILCKGGGIYHLCFEVPDIGAAIDSLVESGSFLISGPTPAVAFEMRPLAWLFTEAEILVELVQAATA
jgi:methylmalonyl-CoA/ethylmalonyl-CoA epimerase